MSSSHTIEKQSGLVKREFAAGLRPAAYRRREWRDMPGNSYDVRMLQDTGRGSSPCRVAIHEQVSGNEKKQVIEWRFAGYAPNYFERR